jgi:redox-sensitive bicupin YhaK (pirin superfamily)
VPAAGNPKSLRTLYFFRGSSLRVAGEMLDAHAAVVVRSDADVPLEAGPDECEILLLQGRPIGETVVQHGPFVMNTEAQIQQAMQDYQRTRFGGWPWPADDPVHAREEGRFAKHADGRVERVDE